MDGFVRKEDECVESVVVKGQAQTILKNFEQELQEKKGRYMCGMEESAQISFVSFKQALQERGRELKDSYSPLFRQVFDLLNANDGSYDIHWKKLTDNTKPEISFT